MTKENKFNSECFKLLYSWRWPIVFIVVLLISAFHHNQAVQLNYQLQIEKLKVDSQKR